MHNSSLYVQRCVAVLFGLNLIDAVLTVIWVQNGIATEANGIMDAFLSMGVLPFLAAKIAMGAFFAIVMLIGSNYTLARVGVTVVLMIYGLTMGIHVFTGVAASGILS